MSLNRRREPRFNVSNTPSSIIWDISDRGAQIFTDESFNIGRQVELNAQQLSLAISLAMKEGSSEYQDSLDTQISEYVMGIIRNEYGNDTIGIEFNRSLSEQVPSLTMFSKEAKEKNKSEEEKLNDNFIVFLEVLKQKFETTLDVIEAKLEDPSLLDKSTIYYDEVEPLAQILKNLTFIPSNDLNTKNEAQKKSTKNDFKNFIKILSHEEFSFELNDEIPSSKSYFIERLNKIQLGFIRHDLSNLLVVFGYLEILDTEEEEKAKNIKEIKIAIKQARAYLEKMPYFLKEKNPQKIIEHLKERVFSHEKIDINLDTSLDNVDINFLHTLFYPIIDNAIAHSEATKINISITKENGTYRISISDNGEGIDLSGLNVSPEQIEQEGSNVILRKGITSKKTGGEALYLLQNNIDRQQGSVEVRSTAEGIAGTEFLITV